MRTSWPALVLSFVLASPAHAALDAAWRALPPTLAADSLAPRLRMLELRPTATVSAGAAGFALGQLHYARGEYRQASDAFARSAGRLSGDERSEVRYWSGLTSLALSDPVAARTAFAQVGGGRRALAQLGTAFAWEQEQHPEKAYDVLRDLLAGDAGEATAPALDRFAQLAERLHHGADAERARTRLAREFGGTVEAARTSATPPPAPAAGIAEPVAVQIGAFADEARARTLVEAARREGFSEAALVRRKTADGSALFVVRLGRYAGREEAARAGERVQKALGVGWQVEKP
ncbi:MAG: SPOR domain-containing protein [Candidatus Eisenbacteria bacterium]